MRVPPAGLGSGRSRGFAAGSGPVVPRAHVGLGSGRSRRGWCRVRFRSVPRVRFGLGSGWSRSAAVGSGSGPPAGLGSGWSRGLGAAGWSPRARVASGRLPRARVRFAPGRVLLWGTGVGQGDSRNLPRSSRLRSRRGDPDRRWPPVRAVYVPVRLAAVVLAVTTAAGCVSVGGDGESGSARPSSSAAGQRAGEAPDGGSVLEDGDARAEGGRHAGKHGAKKRGKHGARGAKPSGAAPGRGKRAKRPAEASGGQGGHGAGRGGGRGNGGGSGEAGSGGPPQPGATGGEPVPSEPAAPTPTQEPETPSPPEPTTAEPSASAHEPVSRMVEREEARPSPEAGVPV